MVEGADGEWVCDGRRRDRRDNEKNECCAGGGRFKIDFPGLGSVTADDEGDVDDVAAMLVTRSS